MPELHRIVVRSVGTATPALPAALARALPLAPERLARCLYQAPAVLLDGLAEPQARAIRDLLAETGLEVDVTPAGERVQEGGPELELAVHVRDASRFREVAAAVSRFIGCDPARAVALLCAAPPVVLGQVSQATADSLAERLRPLGAEVDASRTAEARYDVFVDDTAPQLRSRIVRQLADAGVSAETEGPLVALGVPRSAAQLLWTRIGADSKWRMVDQAFQRFDIVLNDAPDTPAAAEALVAVTGMPEALVPKVRARVPLVLREALPGAAVAAVLCRLAEAGVGASAQLITFTTWDVIVRTASDPAAAAEVLARILHRERPPIHLALRRVPARIDAATGLTRGRWLVHELAAAGADAVLEDR